MRPWLQALRKDLLYARWLIAGWALFPLPYLVFHIVETGMFTNRMPGEIYQNPIALLASTGGLALYAEFGLICWFMYEGALFDGRFWVMRPARRVPMLTAKLTALLLVIMVPGLVAESAFMAAWGVRLQDIALADITILAGCLACPLLLFAAAVFTRNPVHMFIVTVVAVVGWSFTTEIVLSEAALDKLTAAGSPGGVPTVAWVCVMAAIPLLIWWYQRGGNWAIAFGLSFVLFPFAGGSPKILMLRLQAWAETRSPSEWSTRLSLRPLLDQRESVAEGSSAVLVRAPVLLDGLPDEYTAWPSISRASIRFDDGAIEFVRRLTGFHSSAYYPLPPAHGRFEPSLAGLRKGFHEIAAAGPTDTESLPVLIRVSRTDFTKYATRPGHYTTDLTYAIYHHQPLGTYPLQPGARHMDGSRRLELLPPASPPANGACAIDIRQTRLNIPWQPNAPIPLGYRFTDRAGRLLRSISVGLQQSHGFEGILIAPNNMEPPFQVTYEALRIVPLALTDAPDAPNAPTISCADVRMTVVRTTYAGTVTRQLGAPNFVLGPLTRDDDAVKRAR